MMLKNNKRKEEEEKQPKRLSKADLWLIATATIGAGMGIYGFIQGNQFGYRRGFRDGEIFANDELRGFVKHMTDRFEASKGK